MKSDSNPKRNCSLWAPLLCIVALVPHPCMLAQDVYLTLLSRPTYLVGVKHGQISTLEVGHAFMMISVNTRNGPREEIPFGFYPDTSDPKNVVIGFPGALNREYDKHPNPMDGPFDGVTASVKVPITLFQSRSIYKLVDTFNQTRYNLLENNCIDFVDRVAGAASLPRPNRSPLQTPTQYITALRSLVQDGQLREEAERRRAAAEAEAQRVAAAREAKERAQAAEMQAQAYRAYQLAHVPAGWIPCACPAAHAGVQSVWIGQTLYHNPNLICPR